MGNDMMNALGSSMGNFAASMKPDSVGGRLGMIGNDLAEAQSMRDSLKKQKDEQEKQKKGAKGGSVGSMLGSIAGAALAPLTGGASLAATAALSGAGSAIGGAAGTALSGGDVDLGQMAMDFGTGAMGQVMGAGAGKMMGGMGGSAGGAGKGLKMARNMFGADTSGSMLAKEATKKAVMGNIGNQMMGQMFTKGGGSMMGGGGGMFPIASLMSQDQMVGNPNMAYFK